MMSSDRFYTLRARDTLVIIDAAIGTAPHWLYWGPNLSYTSPEQIALLTVRQHVHGGPDRVLSPSLFAELGSGVTEQIGFAAHREGRAWASQFRVDAVQQTGDTQLLLQCSDTTLQTRADVSMTLSDTSGVLACSMTIENRGKAPLTLDQCASATLPLSSEARRWFGFTGRWANEFQIEEVTAFTGTYLRENRTGRTSHHSFPGFVAATEGTNEQTGLCWGVHLGWSGNHRLSVHRGPDGTQRVQAGELFFPGELRLGPGESYTTPTLYAAASRHGMSDLSQRFHTHVRAVLTDGRVRRKPRPVHFNTWEAVYFDHEPKALKALADKAADLGVERFILDDGWFGDRRSDRAGLGDWTVSEAVYPNGLGPLIDHVVDLGMEFGLWFEPEMVNPDSDVFRNHPDWVLSAEGVEDIPFRHQYVLDLTRKEVSDHVFQQIHALLSKHQISYIKWDMNRDIHHPGSAGHAVASKQTHAVYALIDRIRAAHPELEIESCASGGGRADFGMLRRTDRIWTSDSNDALDRQTIQRGASHFFPLEVLGAHVGPQTCHITGRKLSMKLRVATALFGHMGLELDVLKEADRDLETLKAGIDLYKECRSLLHAGAHHRIDAPSHINAVSVISEDQSQALVSWCNLTGHPETQPGQLRFVGLIPDANYRVQIVWPQPATAQTKPSILEAAQLNEDGAIFSSEALMHVGLQLPVLFPQSCLIFRLSQTS